MGRGVNNMALTWRRYSKIFRMYNKRRVFIEGMAPSEESRRMYEADTLVFRETYIRESHSA